MFYSSKQLAKTLVQLVEENPGKQEKIIKGFLVFCKEKNLLNQLPNILKHLEIIDNNKKELEQLHIQSSQPLSQGIIQSIQKLVKAPAQATVNTAPNPDLTGGFIAKYNGVIYDASIQTQLANIKQAVQI